MQNTTTPDQAIFLLKLLEGHPELAAMASKLLAAGAAYDAAPDFLAASVPLMKQAFKADYVAVVRLNQGQWTAVAELGHKQPLPTPLLANVLDDEVARLSGQWVAAILEPKSSSGEILAIALPGGPQRATAEAVDLLAKVCGVAMKTVQERHQQKWRIVRLEAILDVASRWNQHHHVEALLIDIAEAATKLMNADRASIFLWDRASRELVARPALGVKDEDELRVKDDKGIVGKVVHSGEPMRVGADAGQEQIDRQVDKRLKYRTRTLLCVPLRSRRGEILGAFEAINKKTGDFNDDDQGTLTELAEQAAVALENVRERQALLQSRRLMTEQAASAVQLIGRAPAIETLRATIRRVAATDLAVLILGENGTGKEVVSQLIHYLSHRRDQPFIAVNCAAISETLLESELFGHEKGAFTDAHEAHPGKFELASGGTLFLDEIGDLSPGGQSKLLRVLEEKLVVRVGGSKPIHTDARVIAATNQDLAVMVLEKKFRQDLYFRLNVVMLEVPPLRERPEDIVLLAEHFLEDFCKRARRPMLRLTEGARRRLQTHAWPGNVRELRNLMERLAYLSTTDEIEANDPALVILPSASHGAAPTLNGPLAEATDRFQVHYIEQAIQRARGNMQEAATQLGLHRSNLYRKMRQLGMSAGA